MEISIRVKCMCGAELTRKGIQHDHEEFDLVILIEPCPMCIKEANDKGYQDGKEIFGRDE